MTPSVDESSERMRDKYDPSREEIDRIFGIKKPSGNPHFDEKGRASLPGLDKPDEYSPNPEMRQG